MMSSADSRCRTVGSAGFIAPIIGGRTILRPARVESRGQSTPGLRALAFLVAPAKAAAATARRQHHGRRIDGPAIVPQTARQVQERAQQAFGERAPSRAGGLHKKTRLPAAAANAFSVSRFARRLFLGEAAAPWRLCGIGSPAYRGCGAVLAGPMAAPVARFAAVIPTATNARRTCRAPPFPQSDEFAVSGNGC